MDSRSDAELIAAVRTGDNRSYEALWHRHFDAGVRYAKRYYPAAPEDLASEAFLAIYRQLTTTPKGPTFAFRSYLKSVVRNTGLTWTKGAPDVVNEEVDRVDDRDALTLAEQDADSVELLAAFQELPERWQRVLWLAEVAEVSRPEIARELGVRPNTVSTLQNRARSRLKYQWFLRQVPPALRDDTAHVARLLPKYLTDLKDTALATEVGEHIDTCSSCGELLTEMRMSATRIQGGALSLALGGALGAGGATAGLLSTGGTAAAAIAGGGLLTWLFAGGIGAATVGGLVLTGLTLTAPDPTTAPHVALSAPGPLTPDVDPAPSALRSSVTPLSPDTSPRPDGHPPVTGTTPLGREVDDPSIPTTQLAPVTGWDFPVVQRVPIPAPSGIPDPAVPEGSGPEAPAEMSPGVTTPVATTGYFAPVIAGQAAPGNSVVVDFRGSRYTPEVAADGTWNFDTRGMARNPGSYAYRVWAFDDTAQSTVTTGTFTVLPVGVQGFEGLTGLQDMTVIEARSTGLVVSVTGPANGRLYVTSMAGPSAYITLDSSGHAVQRLLMNAHGWYYFTFQAVDEEGFLGSGVDAAVDVYDPDVIFDPWGSDPDDMTFEFVEP